MTHKAGNGTPAWVEQLNEDVIVKDTDDASWFMGGYSGMPVRYHNDNGYLNAYDSSYRKRYHDEASLRSRSTLSRRHRRNTCCLLVFLIFAALLVAIGIGLMMYYLLRPDETKYQARIANGSLPLLNVPYSQDMLDPNSNSFKNIENSLCEEIDTYFKKSDYADQYERCKIDNLRLDETPLPCECSNITSPLRTDNVRANINLVFGGDVHRDIIQGIIHRNTRRISGVDYDVEMVGDYVVDIESHLEKPTPDSGVRANLTIWVYNLTYSSDLEQSNTDSFKELAGPFCQDLRRIFLLSELRSRFYSCYVQKFSENPDIVITDVWFTGTDVFGLATSVKQIVLDNAREVTVSNTMRKIVGTLLITPETGIDPNISVIPIPVNPEDTTISPTPTTRPPKWKDGMPYIETLLNFTGVDYNASLWDTSSNFFQYHANKFCKDLERMVMQSSLKQHYYDCNLLNMYPPSNGQLYPYLRTVIHINSNINSPTDLINVIETHADKYNLPGDLETYRVGDLYVVLKDGQFDIYTSSYGIDKTTVFPTPTSLFPSMFTTYSFSTPTRTPGGTVTPPVSTIVIVYNATAAFIESKLIDFIYTPDLQGTTSQRFMALEGPFCDEIDSYFMSSTLRSAYQSCKITSFTSEPKLSFVLHFTAPRGDHLQRTVPAVLIEKAPKVRINQYTALHIGDLNLLFRDIDFTVSATNFTYDQTPIITPTASVTVTTTKIPKYSATLLNIFCDVASDIAPLLEDKNSNMFRTQERDFCQAMKDVFVFDVRTAETYLDCYIMEFSSATSRVHFHTIFAEDATEEFGDAVIDIVHRLAKQILFRQSGHLDIGGVILERDSCSMNIYPVNYSDPHTTLFTTLTPTSQMILPTAGVDHCLRNPCENQGSCYEAMGTYVCMCATGYTGRDCEIDVNECNTTPAVCQNGGTCHNRQGGFHCACYPGYIGDRCEIVIDRCLSSPCKNDATCTGSEVQLCICASGWRGETCEQDEDECQRVPNVCQFNGTCENEIGSFKCNCMKGRTGPTCEEGIDECQTINPCSNGATCLDTIYSYTCICKTGWTGQNCTEDIDECSKSPPICLHNGSCDNTDGGYNCTCSSGWTGDRCELDVDECTTTFPCQNNATCTNKRGSFLCTCSFGWRGLLCQYDIDECVETPDVCRNGGSCINEMGDYRCECPAGRGGKNCDYSTDPCNDIVCAHDGTCYIDTNGDPMCYCTDHYHGQYCQEDFDECNSTVNPCVNGTCKNAPGSFYCDCNKGYTGHLCDEDVNECDFYPCENGQCMNTVGSYYCDCYPGWEGWDCGSDQKECSKVSNPCNGHGRCEEIPGSYKCVCYFGYEGQFCQNVTDECQTNQCTNGGTCLNYLGGYRCKCTEYWTGQYCDIDLNECTTQTEPCLHDGKCVNKNLGYNCTCTSKWRGETCDEDVDECNETPGICQNDGTCENEQGGFTCHCTDGYKDELCQTDIDECMTSKPCLNGATCRNTNGSYECTCAKGFDGRNCEIDIDECLDDPCQNDATCMNSPPGDYTCKCTDRWSGKNCEIEVERCPECENGGVCVEENSDFKCKCPAEWQGDTCQEDKDECLTITCMHGGTCNNTVGSYSCDDCDSGWEGQLCEIDKNECPMVTCVQGGTCVNTDGSFYCDNCDSGWEGQLCDTDKNECLTVNCMHGGTCVNIDGSFYCDNCDSGWEGQLCDQDIDECPTVTCVQGGTCVNTDGSFYCDNCDSGWEGQLCDKDKDECPMVTCMHGGTCVNTAGSFYCENCASGWEGQLCDTDANECPTITCMHGGTCVNTVGSFYCANCDIGWSGQLCDKDKDECPFITCMHGGTCVNTLGSFYCENCDNGWEGQLCDKDKNECPMVTCMHGGTCVNTPGSFYCDNCDSGWEGQLCDKDSNECPMVTCMHGGVCVNTNGSFKCENCDSGWEGQLCDKDEDECPFVTCMHGGSCVNTDGSFYCENCDSGWEGQLCDIDSNECPMITCVHGGTCVNSDGSFKCENCDSGWEGQLCDRDKDECPTITCMHGGTCVNTDGSFYCENCDSGWEGQLCDTDINECPSVTCMHSGTCVNNDGSFKCENCDSGWEGQLCDKDINECPTINCMHGGTCVNTNGSFYCDACDNGWEGQLCDEDKNECPTITCVHGGSCVNIDGSFYCENCDNGWEGQLCDTDTNECPTVTCLHGGTCVNTNGSFYCANCDSGWEGQLCDKDTDECPGINCVHGGNCVNNNGSFSCENCDSGWEGQLCDEDINECPVVTCMHGGTCVNTDGSFYCDNCDSGWEGQLCDTDIDECPSVTCMNGGICVNTDGSFYCDNCDSGWEGQLCDTDVNECPAITCMHGGTCVNSGGSFYCDNCDSGWEGQLCDTDIDECPSVTCMNGGTCVNTDGSFYCDNCDSGWEGQLCDTDIDECPSVTCMHGGTCVNTSGSFYCDNCNSGWEGQLCDRDIDECLTVTCMNGGTCVNTSGSFYCDNCDSGWEGQLCDIDINECLNDVCKNGGACTNTPPGSFTCDCVGVWTGATCEQVGSDTFELSFETVGLVITPQLLDNQSDEFQQRQSALCSDLFNFVQQNFLPFETCNIATFTENPAGLNVQLTFEAGQPDLLGAYIKESLFELGDIQRFGDVYGIRLGDMIIKHSDVISTEVTMTKRLLNFTFTPDLELKNSFAFQRYEEAFCTQVQEIMDINAALFPNFMECNVTEFSYDADLDETNFTFTFEFEGTKNATDIMINFDDHLNRNLPKERFDRYEASLLGDFYIYLRDITNFTSVPISYELLNIDWNPELENNQSTLFMNHSVSFCNEVSRLVSEYSSYAESYGGCNVNSYSEVESNPDFVMVNFTMDYYDSLDIPMMQADISQIIYYEVPYERYETDVGHWVSDLIWYKALENYFDVPYDGWIANITFSLFDFGSFTPNLLNSSSEEFRQKQKAFCKGELLDNAEGLLPPTEFSQFYFDRQPQCFIHSYTYDDFSFYDKLKSTVSLLFNGTEPIFASDIHDLIMNNFIGVEVGIEGLYHFIGYDLVSVLDVEEIKVNVKDYDADITVTTPLPEIRDELQMRFQLLNFTLDDDFLNATSFLYTNSSAWFCQDMERMFVGARDNGLPRFGDCSDMNFTMEDGKMYLTFTLSFLDAINDHQETVKQLLRVITEKGTRITLPNDESTVAIVLGPFNVYQDSLQPGITNPQLFGTPSPPT